MKPTALLVILLSGCFFEDSTSFVGDEEAPPDLGGWRLPPGISDPSDGPGDGPGESSSSGEPSSTSGSSEEGSSTSGDDGESSGHGSSSSDGSSGESSSSGGSSEGDTGSSCLHDPCSVGAQLVPTCDACVAEVCAVDNFCCSSGWDANCVTIAGEFCGCA